MNEIRRKKGESWGGGSHVKCAYEESGRKRAGERQGGGEVTIKSFFFRASPFDLPCHFGKKEESPGTEVLLRVTPQHPHHSETGQ